MPRTRYYEWPVTYLRLTHHEQFTNLYLPLQMAAYLLPPGAGAVDERLALIDSTHSRRAEVALVIRADVGWGVTLREE